MWVSAKTKTVPLSNTVLRKYVYRLHPRPRRSPPRIAPRFLATPAFCLWFRARSARRRRTRRRTRRGRRARRASAPGSIPSGGTSRSRARCTPTAWPWRARPPWRTHTPRVTTTKHTPVAPRNTPDTSTLTPTCCQNVLDVTKSLVISRLSHVTKSPPFRIWRYGADLADQQARTSRGRPTCCRQQV